MLELRHDDLGQRLSDPPDPDGGEGGHATEQPSAGEATSCYTEERFGSIWFLVAALLASALLVFLLANLVG